MPNYPLVQNELKQLKHLEKRGITLRDFVRSGRTAKEREPEGGAEAIACPETEAGEEGAITAAAITPPSLPNTQSRPTLVTRAFTERE